ncbi:MAG TPA: proline dehydrogenase family protein [Terriglobales bacterium]|nr:proline dehydrogenase family protein [Terriglobales bacterium]
MSMMRSLLLAASQNRWMREHASRYSFVRHSVNRFMPGESLEDALAAARTLREKQIGTVFTHLGENVRDQVEAEQVGDHYVEALEQIHQHEIGTEISVKLTQLGLDLSAEFCLGQLRRILERENRNSTVWIDMEASNYVDATVDLYRRCLNDFPNVGVCLQAYLYRTREDLERLLPLRPSVRLVKGAYKETAKIAFPSKQDVDKNYFELSQMMLSAKKNGRIIRAAFGTHDLAMIRRIMEFVSCEGMPKNDVEVQMLYGIQRGEQERLAAEGYRSIVLVAYGSYWYPWFVRRLAERPANVWFLVKNVFVR